MGNEQGTGRDAGMMLPVLGCLYMIISLLALPWVSVPLLKNEGFQKDYSLWELHRLPENIENFNQKTAVFREISGETQQISQVIKAGEILRLAAILLAVMLMLGGILAYLKREKSVKFLRAVFLFSALFCLAAGWMRYRGNCILNARMGRENSFWNLTLNSPLEMSSWSYGQLFLSVFFFFSVRQLLDPQEKIAFFKGVSRRVVSLVIIVAGIPLLLLFGIFFLGDRSSVFIGMCMVILGMLPFFMIFERRQPQAREILLIAVMSAVAVVGRLAFFMLPQFKPVSAIVIITGISLGAEAGFLTGVTAGFVSNFFFGQGPWTPWQMFAFGIIGFLAGVFFYRKNGRIPKRWIICVYGGTVVFAVYGLLVDLSSVLTYAGSFSFSAALPIFLSGVPFNLIHGGSTVLFLWILAEPVCRKLARIKRKYGILE